MTDQTFPVPFTHDVDTEGFWQAAERNELAILKCAACGQVLHLPKAYCHSCGSWNTEWTTVQPRGRIYSWTVVHRQIHPAFPAPYTIILIELDDLPAARLIGNLPGAPPIAAGMAVTVEFEAIEGIALPVWRLEAAEITAGAA